MAVVTLLLAASVPEETALGILHGTTGGRRDEPWPLRHSSPEARAPGGSRSAPLLAHSRGAAEMGASPARRNPALPVAGPPVRVPGRLRRCPPRCASGRACPLHGAEAAVDPRVRFSAGCH